MDRLDDHCADIIDMKLKHGGQTEICETETKQVQSQQTRPRLKRYSFNKRDRDSYSQKFETETRKMCIFETETEP